MSEEKERSRIHVHLGGLIFIIIIFLILFKVDLKSFTESLQFQKNLSYVKEQINNIWEEHLAKPLTSTWNGLFNNLIDKGVEQIKKEINLNPSEQINKQKATDLYNNIINVNNNNQ